MQTLISDSMRVQRIVEVVVLVNNELASNRVSILNLALITDPLRH